MILSDFKVGGEFRHDNKIWKCTDVGSRVVVAICTSEVWQTRTQANTFKKEEVKVVNPSPAWFKGPPYSAKEVVFAEHLLSECTSTADCEKCGTPLRGHLHT